MIYINDIYFIPPFFFDHCFNLGEYKFIFHLKDEKMRYFLYREQQYQDNTSREHVHKSHIHIRPSGSH